MGVLHKGRLFILTCVMKLLMGRCFIDCSAAMDTMVMPLQEKTEDWKKVIVQLERDRNRGQSRDFLFVFHV